MRKPSIRVNKAPKENNRVNSSDANQCHDSCYFFIFGRVVRMAIDDFKTYMINRNNKKWTTKNRAIIESAAHFLFDPDGLELQIRYFEIQLNIDAVRKEVSPDYKLIHESYIKSNGQYYGF